VETSAAFPFYCATLAVFVVVLYLAFVLSQALQALEQRMVELQKVNAQLYRLVHLTTGAVAVRDVIRCGAGKIAIRIIDDYAETTGMTHEVEDLRRAFGRDDSPAPPDTDSN